MKTGSIILVGLLLGCDRRARPAVSHDAMAASPIAVTIDATVPPIVLDAAVETATADAPSSDTNEGITEGCPAGMVAVRGNYCNEVEQECLEWMRDGYERCARFCEPSICTGRRRPLQYCIDRYEWPNQPGARPVVLVDWNQATALCASVGRRLCTEDEWTLACEGEAMLPYPYGYTRDETACNIDNLARRYDRAALRRGGAIARAEVERVWMGVPSGDRARCVSPFGVHDMTGNVDEWAVSMTGRPFRSVLKGGWWGRVRTRCRPVTRAHYEHFEYYQIGFRCCADRASTAVVPVTPPAPVRPPP